MLIESGGDIILNEQLLSNETTISSTDHFVQACRSLQPNLSVTSKIFFQGVIALPLEQEFLLQAYFVEHLNEIVGEHAEIILYESPFPGESSNDGKIDIILFTKLYKLLVVETKFITTKSGPTARTKRKNHRNDVVDQVSKNHKKLVEKFGIEPDQIRLVVFTNDMLINNRNDTQEIFYYFVTDEKLNVWRNGLLNDLMARSDNKC